MIIRRAVESDFPGIADLYDECFGLKATLDKYTHWYFYEGQFTSLICEIEGKIVGHNAFIVNNHTINNQPYQVAISSGGMVSPSQKTPPGLFFKLVQESRKQLPNDIVIAFPNKNAELTWIRLLKFNVIENHYLTLYPENFNPTPIFNPIEFNVQRSGDYLVHRLDNHPRNKYTRYELDDFIAYTKLYNGNTELIYISCINNKLVEFIAQLIAEGANRINIISRYSEPLIKLGFTPAEYNKFVYQSSNDSLTNELFDCQMIDSDVF